MRDASPQPPHPLPRRSATETPVKKHYDYVVR